MLDTSNYQKLADGRLHPEEMVYIKDKEDGEVYCLGYVRPDGFVEAITFYTGRETILPPNTFEVTTRPQETNVEFMKKQVEEISRLKKELVGIRKAAQVGLRLGNDAHMKVVLESIVMAVNKKENQ